VVKSPCRCRRSLALAALLALSARVAAGAPGAPADPAAGRLILDETAYCRAYHQFGWDRIDSQRLKAEGQKVLGREGLRRLERDVKRLLAGRGIDWSKADWRDYAVQRDVTISHSMEGDVGRLAASRTPPPPADWTESNFDDARWPRFVKPFAVGPNASLYFSQWSMQSPGLQAGHFRFRFRVPDPSRAGRVTVAAEYIGGVRIFVNGREVARGSLPALDAGQMPRVSDAAASPAEGRAARQGPAGELADEDVPPGYGREAYQTLFAEVREKYRKRWREKNPGKAAPRYYGFANWEMPRGSRIYKARNRTLGPVAVPADALRKGTNVLAVEVRAAPLNPIALSGGGYRGGGGWTNVWLHGSLSTLALRATGDVPSGLGRPKGVQVWAEDMHRRVYDCEYLPAGAGPGRIELVGARNGAYAAQVVVGSDRELTDVAVVPTALRAAATGRAGGASLLASAVRIRGMAGRPAAAITELGGGRIPTRESFYTGRASCFPEFVARERFMPDDADPKAREAAWRKVRYFDHITLEVPRRVPAGTCRPYWVSVRVPPDAAPGVYTGEVRVTAGAGGPTAIPLAIEVVDWRLPEPTGLQTIAAVEQSPYAVARQYGVPLWSEEHFRLIDRSLSELARIGNDWWFVPIILRTEFGNDDDSMVRWVRRAGTSTSPGAGGSLGFDFTILDRYLDRIVRHCGKPRVVSFVVMHGAPAAVDVSVLDAATGRPGRLRLGGRDFDPSGRERSWRAFARALREHMVARGLGEAMHWGYAWDTEGDPLLKPLLKSAAPDVYWTFGAHSRVARGSGGSMHAASLAYYRSIVLIYGLKPGLRSRMGWKRPTPHLLNPRVLSSCHTTEGHSPPFNYRLLIDRALVAGHNGVGRIGGDYWAGTYFHRCVAGAYHLAGFSILKLLWPGPGGAEPSARFEALREGMQEGEARIFMEQVLDRGLLPAELARRAQDVLDRHNIETLYIPVHVAANLNTEGAPGWLARSRRLHRAAAEVARAVGLDTDADAIGLPAERARRQFGAVRVPALGRRALAVRLRNWTGRPRRWTAEASADWSLKAGATVSGTVTVTDAAGGGRRPVRIIAQVGKAAEVALPGDIFNLALGTTERRELTVLNHTHRPMAWALTPPAEWVKVAPASGRVGPRSSAAAVVTVSAPSGEAGYAKDDVRFTAADGKVDQPVALHVFTIPPYETPADLPGGKKVPLAQVHKDIVVSHRSAGIWRRGVSRTARFAKSLSFWHTDRPARIGDKRYDVALWALPYHETVYKLEGSGIRAFSAEVGVNHVVAHGGGTYAAGHENIRVCFEIHVDGRIAAHSGLMKSTDGPRLLVVDGLEKAKEMKLITRLASMLHGDTSYRGQFAHSNWADPGVYK